MLVAIFFTTKFSYFSSRFVLGIFVDNKYFYSIKFSAYDLSISASNSFTEVHLSCFYEVLVLILHWIFFWCFYLELYLILCDILIQCYIRLFDASIKGSSCDVSIGFSLYFFIELFSDASIRFYIQCYIRLSSNVVSGYLVLLLLGSYSYASIGFSFSIFYHIFIWCFNCDLYLTLFLGFPSMSCHDFFSMHHFGYPSMQLWDIHWCAIELSSNLYFKLYEFDALLFFQFLIFDDVSNYHHLMHFFRSCNRGNNLGHQSWTMNRSQWSIIFSFVGVLWTTCIVQILPFDLSIMMTLMLFDLLG